MNKLGCNCILDNDYRCGRTFLLHEIYLRNPYNETSSNTIKLCRICFDQLSKEMNERKTEFSRNLANLKYEQTRQRAASKEYDLPYNNESLSMKIDDLKSLIKRISSLECSNMFCRKLFTTLNQDDKIFTATSFRPNGKRAFTWSYCSEKCFRTIKGKCGLINIEQNKQAVLI